ncbi:DUF982 domain-containing protein [Starkeya sp. 3C]|uniref:DUF982 domain-containing protein n=1 Tax=Ancylobacter moscoviensis TaxID=2597768 RepID=A0ABY3DWS5_9HYPH|nr:DUF982 domain-containing protein [Ancylobacter moscoviensis]TSJ64626.1 DUF982 domain-containing protein [Ancylobacter moscoviensis]
MFSDRMKPLAFGCVMLPMNYVRMDTVHVWQRDATRRSLRDVASAATFLLMNWPRAFMDTDAHRAAQLAALYALDGHIAAVSFRAAFIAAAEEAGVLVEEVLSDRA